MKNGWHAGETLGNRNIPEDGNIVGSLITMGGKIVDTYYNVRGNFYRVGSRLDDTPREIIGHRAYI